MWWIVFRTFLLTLEYQNLWRVTKIRRRAVHKQDIREEAKMASKKEKDSNAKKDWTGNEIPMLIDELEANPCLWDVYHTDYTNLGIKR